MNYIKRQSIANKYLLAKPNIIFWIGFLIILGTGIVGEIFQLGSIPFSPYSNIIGGIIAVGGWLFHMYCHRAHKDGHKKSEHIGKIIQTGIFQKIRHPMYLGLILTFFGLAIAWGIILMLIPAILFSILAIIIALKEEEFLLNKFGSEYEGYMRRVHWRFIPKIF